MTFVVVCGHGTYEVVADSFQPAGENVVFFFKIGDDGAVTATGYFTQVQVVTTKE